MKQPPESVVKDVGAKLGHSRLVEALVEVHHARGSSVGSLPCERLAGRGLRCWHAALQAQSAVKTAESLRVEAPQSFNLPIGSAWPGDEYLTVGRLQRDTGAHASPSNPQPAKHFGARNVWPFKVLQGSLRQGAIQCWRRGHTGNGLTGVYFLCTSCWVLSQPKLLILHVNGWEIAGHQISPRWMEECVISLFFFTAPAAMRQRIPAHCPAGPGDPWWDRSMEGAPPICPRAGCPPSGAQSGHCRRKALPARCPAPGTRPAARSWDLLLPTPRRLRALWNQTTRSCFLRCVFDKEN